MLKKKSLFRVIGMLLTVVLLCGVIAGCSSNSNSGGSSGGDEKFVISASIHDPAQSVKTIFLKEYAERVFAATDGQVEMQVFEGGVLAGAGAALEAVTNNTVDVAWCFSSYFPGQFPLCDVVAQPLMGARDCMQVTNTLWDLWGKYDEMKQELDARYKVLHLYVNPPNTLFFANAEVDSIEKLQGLTLRAAAGTITDILGLWGANPIFMGPPDVYEALEKGIVDGYCFEFSGMYDFKLFEHTKYYQDMNIYCGPFLLLMNKDIWDSFPKSVQDKIDSVSGRDCSIEMATVFQNDQDFKKETVLARSDAVVVNVSPAEYAKFEAIAMQYNAEWAAKNTTSSFDAAAFMADAISILAKY
ncbi:MAG: TRAP transporter substrate-binding protein DctP [Oscillospiraceae bacterium]|nr:TRAP transporter substrate-binding protein DctP [Oscillospiraceae bacterium]